MTRALGRLLLSTLVLSLGAGAEATMNLASKSRTGLFGHLEISPYVLFNGSLSQVSRGGVAGMFTLGYDLTPSFGLSVAAEVTASLESATPIPEVKEGSRFVTYGFLVGAHHLRTLSADWRLSPFAQLGSVLHTSHVLGHLDSLKKPLGVVRGGVRLLRNDPGARVGFFVAVTSYLTFPGASFGVNAGMTLGLD